MSMASLIFRRIEELKKGQMMNERLKGKTVVITGASGGLGEKIAHLCAASGARPVLLARNQEKLAQVARQIGDGQHVDCLPIVCDLSRQEEIPSVFQEILQETGGSIYLSTMPAMAFLPRLGKCRWLICKGCFPSTSLA